MPSPSEKLARSLEALASLQRSGRVAIRSADLSRTDRERLLKNGFLTDVMKGWYLSSHPDRAAGESTPWLTSFWSFAADYLSDRFQTDWCISPEQSLCLHVGNRTVPRQLVVRSPKGKNNTTELPFHTSILDVQLSLPDTRNIVVLEGLRLYSLPASLVFSSPTFFRQNATDVRAALSAIPNASDLLTILLDGGHNIIGGRLAGALRNVGRARLADEIVASMKAADYECREEDPFDAVAPVCFSRTERSPSVSRMKLLWESMREPVIERFPEALGLPKDKQAYLDRVQENYVTDAYHSLSIEGYRVSPALIEKVRFGTWNPDGNNTDREHRNALAARGYWQAYQQVKQSISSVLAGANAGTIADNDHGTWYRELFAPSVAAGLLKPADLAGYRTDQVYIRHSKHVPPNKDAVRDLMPALFDLLRDEEAAPVRVVLGHFFFVYIHPYMDGNGRTGRFLMNVMLASGGYPWTIVPVTRRVDYMAALEEASVNQNIVPLADLLSSLVAETLAGNPEAL